MITRPLNVALVGAGVMGSQHLRVLQSLDEFNIIAIADPNISEIKFNCDLSNIQLISNWRHIANLEVQAVVSASPTTFHREQSIYFMERGIHVLLEKPIAIDVQQANEISSAAIANDVTLLIGQIERFNPAGVKLKSLIDAGELGTILSISTRRVGVARPTQPSTNVIFDLGIHDIDVMRMLTHTKPSLVSAIGGSLPGNSMEDFAFLLLQFGRIPASVETNWMTPMKSRRLSVTGTEGFVDLDYISQDIKLYKGSYETYGLEKDYFAFSRMVDPEIIIVSKGEPLKIELMHFLNCIRGIEENLVTSESVIDSLQMCIDATKFIHAKSVRE